jgi:hypothetical protein
MLTLTKGIVWATVNVENIPLQKGFIPANHLHVTLAFGVSPEGWKLGRKIAIYATKVAWNREIQAVQVLLPQGVKSCNQTPHITVGHLEGIPPFKSNEMLSGPHDSIIYKKKIEGTIEFLEWKN